MDDKVKRPVIIDMESAKGELMNALASIEQKYGLPSYIMEGIITSILADIRSQKSLEIMNAFNFMENQKEG